MAPLTRIVDVKLKIRQPTSTSAPDPKVARERLETAINSIALESEETITIEDILIGDEALG